MTKRTLSAALLIAALVAPAFAGAAPVRSLNAIVAVVNDDVVTATELEERTRTIVRQLERQNTPLPPPQTLYRQVLDRLILDRLQLQMARDKGIRVDDEQVNLVVTNIARENNLTLEQFREVLERDGFDFAAFRQGIREEILIGRVRASQVENRVNVTPQEVESFIETLQSTGAIDTEYRLQHILVSVPEAATPIQIERAKTRAEQLLARIRAGADFAQTAAADSDGQQAFEGGDLGWRKMGQIPTIFTEAVGSMSIGEVAGPIRSPSGYHLLRLADRRGEQQSLVEQSHARHILVRTNEITSDYEARQKLERLRLRLVNGADFAELARANSEDPGSARNGGDLGWSSPGDFVPQFEKTLAGLKPGEISQPFQSPFGWHVVQLLERREVDNTQDRLRARAHEALRERKIEEDLQDWLRRLRDEAFIEYRLENLE